MLTNLTAIVAYDKTRGIGLNGDMPWGRSLKSDLENFKQLTTGNTVIMGRKTYDSIGRALPHRKTIVLSQDLNLRLLDAQVCNDPLLLSEAELVGAAYVIGGSEIYQLMERFTSAIEATEVDGIFESDTKLVAFSGKQWSEVSRSRVEASEKDAYSFDFVRYERND